MADDSTSSSLSSSVLEDIFAPSDDESNGERGPTVATTGYQFEPTRNDTDDSEPVMPFIPDATLAAAQGRTLEDSNDWCQCGYCETMATDRECICCQERAQVQAKMEDVQCITDLNTFVEVCLSRDVLDVALLMMAEIMARPAHTPPTNRTLRLAAYRQFVLWTYGRTGRHNRRIIPSCVVTTIRNKYPEEDGQYEGFHEFFE